MRKHELAALTLSMLGIVTMSIALIMALFNIMPLLAFALMFVACLLASIAFVDTSGKRG